MNDADLDAEFDRLSALNANTENAVGGMTEAELDAEFDRLSAGGSAVGKPVDEMSEAELDAEFDRLNGSDLPEERQTQPDYGFFDRREDQLKAERGAYAPEGGVGVAQTLVEGLTPFQREMQKGRARSGSKKLYGFIGDGAALKDALDKHGDAPDPALKGYKARQIGNFEGGVRQFGHEMFAHLKELPFFGGSQYQLAQLAARKAYNTHATDVLIDWARDTHQFDDQDIENAKEYSQGDPRKMYEFFSKAAEIIVGEGADAKERAQANLEKHKDDQSVGGKIAAGTLDMIPMMEEFILAGAAGKALGVGTKVVQAGTKSASAIWRANVVNGMKHATWMTPTMGTEMARRRYEELTADEYRKNEKGDLIKVEGDDAGTALMKAAIGGYGEAAIFSLPFGEAAFGWAAPMITKSLKTHAGKTVAKMYENYVKYGQMTGLRGQPMMLAQMDINSFKDGVLGMGVKDSEYKGFDESWKKFKDETLSVKGQMDLFVSALGVIALQGGTALAKSRIALGRDRRSMDSVLRDYYHVPDETLKQMSPELKSMWRQLIMFRARGGKFAMTEENLRKICDNMAKNLGLASGEVWEKMGQYALKFDNSVGWENVGNASDFQSKFKVPLTLQAERGKDGNWVTRRIVPWQDAEVPLPDGTVTSGQVFTDPDTGISVMKYQPIDPAKGDNGWIYLIADGEGRRATRMGFKDALDAANEMSRKSQLNRSQNAANEMSRKSQLNRSQNAAKKDALAKMYGEMFPGESPLAVDSAEQASKILGRELGAGESAFTDKNGRQYYVLDRMQTPEQMKKVVMHEAGRHRGLDLVLPDAKAKIGFLVGLAKSGDPVIQDQLNRIVEARMARGEKVFGKDIEGVWDLFKTDKDGNYDPNAANALEEVYAHLFDHEGVPGEPGWWDAHMNAVRRNLRKVFHGLSYSRAEAEEMYRGAMERLAEQTGGEVEYIPEQTGRERMVAEQRQREEDKRIGHEAERDVADIRSGEERDRKKNEAVGEKVQAEADAVRNAEGAEAVRGAFAAEGLKMGMGRERAAAERKAEEDRVEKEREVGRRRQDEIAKQKADMEEWEKGEAERKAAEAKAEQDARDEAELQRLIDEEERETDMAKREEYQKRRREITERRAREKAIAKEEAEAEAVQAAQEREKQAQEREAQRRAGYEAADEQARLDRKNAVKQALREDDARKAEEFDRKEAERKRREAEEEANGLPRITVEEAEPTKSRTAPQKDVVRVNYGAGDGREGHQIVARRVSDENGNVIGWDVNAVAKDGTETLIASTTKQKRNGEAAIRAVRKQIHEHFGLPYGKDAEKAMEAERAKLDEAEKKEVKDEARNVRDEEPAKPEQGEGRGLPAEGEEVRPAEEGEADGEGELVVHHANEGRSGDLMQAGDDALMSMFGDEPAETPVEAPVSASRDEGTTSRPERAEGAEGGKSASGGKPADDAGSFIRNLPPDFKFFDEREELMDDARRDGNQRLVNLIGNLYDQKKVRGFNGFAKMVKSENPALWAEQKNRLPALWNYAAQLSDGKIPRVGDYEARDVIKGVDEGRNVRDVRGINALQAALQDVDVEMYPAAKLDSSDARVPNTKLAADPQTGIIPGHELKGRPRSLLAKPILGVEFEDGTVAVGTGRHRKNLYERYGMDIPMRRVKESDGWVTKKPDGTYDFTKIRLLDALDNIQDSKGTIEDYVAFFRDVQIPRAEAESEGFLSSKEARTAYALANDAIDDVRNSANFEGGRRAGYISPEQAGAIADAAPKGAWEHNETVQRQLLKDVLKDRSMDATDISVDAGLIADDIRREIAKGKVFQMDLFGNVIDAGAELREKKRDYIRDQISRYERLAKTIRANKNTGMNLSRDDMRSLGINERNVNKDEKTRKAEYEKAAQRAALRAMEWRTGITSQLKPEDRAQMERDLGIEPKEADGRDTPASGPLPQASAGVPAPATAAEGSRVPAASTMETPPPVDQTGAVGDRVSASRGGRNGIVRKPAGNFKRGDTVIVSRDGKARTGTFLSDNGDGSVSVRFRRPDPRNPYASQTVDERIPIGEIRSSGMKDALNATERRTLANAIREQGDFRFFNAEEELTPERNRDYADWLGKYKLSDSSERRREWLKKNPEKATQEALEKAAFDARQYEPAKYKVPGAVKSRTLLEEPPALRATEPPDNDYKLHIPEDIIKKGDLQEHQAEFVGYAGKAHENVQPNGSRLGMMGGYGTGAGKSRMIAGIILDNRNQGRKRALWITTQSGLVDDVRSESKPFGMGDKVYEMFGGEGVAVPKDGIGFGTYHGLRQEGVVEKIAQQLGKDFDGVIAFDEIHRAKTEGGNTQNAVVKLQELLPKARVVYMSATGATDVGNLGYGQRLGLWGEGTAFKDFEDFKKKVEGKGVSAMEMVAQTLKRRGQYLSANLSKEGVEFDHVSVPTTEAQKKTYAEYNGALKDVYKGVYDALEAMGRLDYTVPPSSLHGMQQRLHYSMVTALKVPILIERAKQELAKGNVPVFSLVNTNEAGATREIAKALERGEKLEMDDVNFGPKQILLDFLTKEGEKSFQGKKDAYKDYQFPTMKPVKDAGGNVVGFERDQIADGIRRRLVSAIEKLPDDFGNPINMIVAAFGKDNVANLTGLNREGMARDYKAFQDGEKKVLVFSGVANTGYTFSSDQKYKNQARRVAFPLQLGFRADELEQTLGRVHRNNQANAPIYVASTTDLPGERRFYSSVERRRGQMKALTTGDRSAVGNGITSEGDNFETKYAQQAVDGVIATLHRMGKLDALARKMNFVKRVQRADGSVVEVNGMLKRDKSGATLPNVTAKRFLNRLLMLEPKDQDALFTGFKRYLDQIVTWAKEDGEYDVGMQDIGSTRNDAVRSVKLSDDMEVGHVNSWFKTDKQTFDDFAQAHAAEFLTYVRNKRTGETFAVRADGKMGRKQEPAAMRYGVDGTKRRMKASILDTEKDGAAYERLDAARAKELWDAEYGVIPDERADDGFYAHGDLLKHWADVLGSKPPRTFRVKAGDAPEYIGAKIDADEIPAIFGRFGKAEAARDMVIDGKVREVLNNRTVDLVNGWTLKQVPRDGAKKVMVRGVEPGQLEAVAKELGGEVSKKRIFMEPDAAKLRKIIEEHPANLYRDDERIGDTGNLRFFNIDEEAGRRVHAKDYDEALRMEGAGAGRREIWEKTGWWRGKDGKMRYEIAGISQADTKRMLDFALASGKFYDKNKANVYTFTLSELEKAMKEKGERLPSSVKTLLAAYPKLSDMRVEVDRMAEQPKDGTLGYATSGRGAGTIHLYERGATADTFNHEVQHRIQELSGMAGGTDTKGKSFDRYAHEHGEWEARQASARAEMSDEERGKTAPWETKDEHGVEEDATQIDDANKKRIRPDGAPKEPEPVAPAAERETTVGEKATTNLIDRFEPVRQMEIATGHRGKNDLYAEKSPYNALRLLDGRNEASRQSYEKIWKAPLEKMLRESGVTLDDVGMYGIAMNAKDRNRKVLNRSGALDGAGLSDADADIILSDLKKHLGAKKFKAIEDKIFPHLWKMQKEGMERRVESGRVSREIADLWEAEEPHHVPMRDDLSEDGVDYNRSTRRWTRHDYQKAEGRYTLPDNPVAFMLKEYQDAMYGSNANDARRVLADFVRSNPGIGKIRRGVRKGKAWSFTHNQIEDFPDPRYHEKTKYDQTGLPNLVAFKEGGDLHMIELSGKQGERVAAAVTGRDVVRAEDLPVVGKAVAAATRAYASTATEYSLGFLKRNFGSDQIEAALNTMADKGVLKGGFSAVKNVINAIKMAPTIRKYIKTARFEGKYADIMRRYVESGALIGGMGNEGITEIKSDLGKVASGKHGVKDVLKFIFRGISNINKQGELATRVSVFKDYIDGGASDGEAAMRSREYSTDFNKYGNQRWMNTVWMFSGSVIGSDVRQVASLARGKHGTQLAVSLMALGLFEGLLESWFNSEEDERAKTSGGPSDETFSEYNRANSLYFRIGGEYVRFPMHAGPFSVLKYAGNCLARAAMGNIKWEDAAGNIGKEAAENGMHFTGTGDFNADVPVQSLLPTLVVPFYQIKGDEDHTGKPIRKPMYSKTKPYSENGRKSTGDVWKSIARWMNSATGGNGRRRGWFDYSPENYKFVFESLAKNVGRDVATVVDFVTDISEGKPWGDIDNSHVPIASDYWRDVPDNTQNFIQAKDRYEKDRADGTLKPGSRKDDTIKGLISEINTLRHWEDGEEKVGSLWVKRKNPSEATKEKHKKLRLKYQQRVVNLIKKD